MSSSVSSEQKTIHLGVLKCLKRTENNPPRCPFFSRFFCGLLTLALLSSDEVSSNQAGCTFSSQAMRQVVLALGPGSACSRRFRLGCRAKGSSSSCFCSFAPNNIISISRRFFYWSTKTNLSLFVCYNRKQHCKCQLLHVADVWLVLEPRRGASGFPSTPRDPKQQTHPCVCVCVCVWWSWYPLQLEGKTESRLFVGRTFRMSHAHSMSLKWFSYPQTKALPPKGGGGKEAQAAFFWVRGRGLAAPFGFLAVAYTYIYIERKYGCPFLRVHVFVVFKGQPQGIPLFSPTAGSYWVSAQLGSGVVWGSFLSGRVPFRCWGYRMGFFLWGGVPHTHMCDLEVGGTVHGPHATVVRAY